MPRRRGPTAGDLASVAVLLALGLLGMVTGLLGSLIHLAHTDVAGLSVPHGLVLALGLVLGTDAAVAAASAAYRRPGAGRALLALAAGRGLLLGLLLLPRTDGDVVLTGLPASTVWILLAVLLPAFAAPLVTAVATTRARVTAPGPAAFAASR